MSQDSSTSILVVENMGVYMTQRLLVIEDEPTFSDFYLTILRVKDMR